MKIAFCTISSLNYAAQVHVLADSISRHVPQEPLHWLVVDRKTDQVPDLPTHVKIWWAEDLGIEVFEKLAYCYDIIEFNTLLKPDFLLRLLRDGYGEVVAYFDPDTALFSDVQWLQEAHRDADAVVTPHALSAPDTDEASLFLRNGVFNFGFASFKKGEEALGFLKWWRRMCYEAGFNDPASGLFVDQKWANYLPILVPKTCILREPGANVAFWNLHERTIAAIGDAVTVNGRPLLFFHFSGLKFSAEGRVTPKPELARFLTPNSALSQLVESYSAQASSVRAGIVSPSYSFDFHTNGAPVNPIARRAYVYSEYRFESASPFSADSRWFMSAVRNGLIEARPRSPSRSVEVTKRMQENMAIWLRARRVWRHLPRLIGIERYARLIGFLRVLSASRNQGKIWASECPPLGIPIKLTFSTPDQLDQDSQSLARAHYGRGSS